MLQKEIQAVKNLIPPHQDNCLFCRGYLAGVKDSTEILENFQEAEMDAIAAHYAPELCSICKVNSCEPDSLSCKNCSEKSQYS